MGPPPPPPLLPLASRERILLKMQATNNEQTLAQMLFVRPLIRPPVRSPDPADSQSAGVRAWGRAEDPHAR